VERRIFLAVLERLRVRVRYASVHSGTDAWRWLQPRVFAHDGNRWHVRAWCEQRADYLRTRLRVPLVDSTGPPRLIEIAE